LLNKSNNINNENILKYSITFNREDILENLFINNLNNSENKIENCTLWKFAKQKNNSKMNKYLIQTKKRYRNNNISNSEK